MQTNAVNGRNMNRAADDLLHFLQLDIERIINLEYLQSGLMQFLAFTRQAKSLLAAIDN